MKSGHTIVLLQSPGISNNDPLRALLVGEPEGRVLYYTYVNGVFMYVHVCAHVHVNVNANADVRVHAHVLPLNNYAGALPPRCLLSF